MPYVIIGAAKGVAAYMKSEVRPTWLPAAQPARSHFCFPRWEGVSLCGPRGALPAAPAHPGVGSRMLCSQPPVPSGGCPHPVSDLSLAPPGEGFSLAAHGVPPSLSLCLCPLLSPWPPFSSLWVPEICTLHPAQMSVTSDLVLVPLHPSSL